MEPQPVPQYRRRVISSLLWQGSSQFLGQLTAWASTILVIRLLDPGDYGLMSMATLFVSFVLMLADLGIGAALVQAEALEEEDLRAIQGLVLVFNALGLGLTLLGSPLVAAFFDEPRLETILNVLSVNFVLLALYSLPQARLVRDLRFESKAKVDFVTLLVSAATSLAFAWQGFGVWALVAGTMSTHLLRTIGFNLIVRGPIIPTWSFQRSSRFVRFGSLIMLDRFLWFLYSNMDITIAGKLLGTELLGFYTVALTLAALPLDKVLPVLTQVAFPAVARIQKEPERVRRNMLTALRYGNLVFLPVFWGMAWVAGDALPLLLGEEWAPAVLPFQMICVILPLKAVGALLPPALFGIGRPDVNVVNMGISLLLLSVAFLIGSRWGLVGLAAGWLFAYPIVFVITTTRALPVLGFGWADLARCWRASWVAALVMSGGVWAVQELLAGGNGAVRLVTAIVIGAACYVGTIVVSDRSAVSDLRGLLAR